MSNDDMLSTVEAAEVIGCTDACVRQMIAREEIKAYKQDGYWRIPRNEVVKAIRNPNRRGRPRGSKNVALEQLRKKRRST